MAEAQGLVANYLRDLARQTVLLLLKAESLKLVLFSAHDGERCRMLDAGHGTLGPQFYMIAVFSEFFLQRGVIENSTPNSEAPTPAMNLVVLAPALAPAPMSSMESDSNS